MNLRLISSRTSTPTRYTKKEQYVSAFDSWNTNPSNVSLPTATHLLGLFYKRYKQKFRLFPCSNVHEDFQNIERFLHTFMAEDPSLAPYVIEYFFSLPQFNGVQTATFCNQNILSRWCAFEHAEKMRSKVGVGEQAEFRSDRRQYGVVRV